MPAIFAKKEISLCLVLLSLAVGCTTTVTKTRTPVFIASLDSLSAGIDSLVHCEHINFNGKEVTTNGKDSTYLEVDIINPKDTSGGKEARTSALRKIATITKGGLQDQNEYQAFLVLFVREHKDGVVTSRTWHGEVFPSAAIPAGGSRNVPDSAK